MTESELREVLQRNGISGQVATCILEEYRLYTNSETLSDGMETWISIADQETLDLDGAAETVSSPMLPTMHSDVLDSVRTEKRYEDAGVLGQGGMGEVRQVHESKLSRHVAMKVIHHQFMEFKECIGSFYREAQVCMPNDIPILFPSMTLGYSMMERYTTRCVRSREMLLPIKSKPFMMVSRVNIWPETGVTLTQLLLQFLEVCEGMAICPLERSRSSRFKTREHNDWDFW